MKFLASIVTLFLLVVGQFCTVQAQVFVGKGLMVKENTNLVVTGGDLKVEADQIKGKGKVKVMASEKGKPLLIASKSFKTEVVLEVGSRSIHSNESKAKEQKQFFAKKQSVKREKLKKSYVNYQGFVYKLDEPLEASQSLAEEVSLPRNDSSEGTFVSSYEHNPPFIFTNLDYSLPIYSNTLTKRFSDFAELYAFENSTALLKPPIFV